MASSNSKCASCTNDAVDGKAYDTFCGILAQFAAPPPKPLICWKCGHRPVLEGNSTCSVCAIAIARSLQLEEERRQQLDEERRSRNDRPPPPPPTYPGGGSSNYQTGSSGGEEVTVDPIEEEEENMDTEEEREEDPFDMDVSSDEEKQVGDNTGYYFRR